jgi:hypothetical protein
MWVYCPPTFDQINFPISPSKKTTKDLKQEGSTELLNLQPQDEMAGRFGGSLFSRLCSSVLLANQFCSALATH